VTAALIVCESVSFALQQSASVNADREIAGPAK